MMNVSHLKILNHLSGLSKLGSWLTALALLAVPNIALAAETAQPSELATKAIEKLKTDHFSTEIQQTLDACWKRGKVNLEAGADQDGSVICGDQYRDSPIGFDVYLSTLSDVLTASGLVGVRQMLKENPQISPWAAASIFRSSNGVRLVRENVQQAVKETKLVAGSKKSVDLLTDRIVQQAMPVLRNPRALQNLLGSKAQYPQVVKSFCTPPGLTLAEAKTAFPGLSSVQLYAICVEDAGIANEILVQLGHKKSRS